MLTETIRQKLEERFLAPLPDYYQRRIVFWKDEDREFEDQIDELDLDQVRLLKLSEHNNFQIQKLLTMDDLENDYLVYDPLPCEDGGRYDWLLDIKLYSEVFEADLFSLLMEEMRIDPTSHMKEVVRQYSRFFNSKERKEKLRRYDQVYQNERHLQLGILSVLSGLSEISLQDILTSILKTGLDKEDHSILLDIEKFGDLSDFWSLVEQYTGYKNGADRPLMDLASHILITALSRTLDETSLGKLWSYVSPSHQTFCYQLIHEWQKSDDQIILRRLCRDVESRLDLPQVFDSLDLDLLLKSDTFPAIQETILKRYFEEIAHEIVRVESLLASIDQRRTTAWYEPVEDYYEALFYVAKIQEFYQARQGHDYWSGNDAKALWQLYQEDAYQMDRYYRHFHVHFGKTLKHPHTLLEDGIKKCSDWVERRYHEWFLKRLSEAWTKAIGSDMASLGYVDQLKQQRRFYSQYLEPLVDKNQRVFVIISDALRYEVATDLADTLNRETRGKVSLDAVQAIFPSITKFGMAALLPGKDLSIGDKIGDKLEVLVDGKSTSGTRQREDILKARHPDSVAVTYNKLIQMKQQDRRDLSKGQKVVYIYHNAIDATGDKTTTESKVFEACDDAIREITAGVKIIVNDMSGTNIFITADHGFLYTHQPLAESQKMGSQIFEGDVLEIGRRYALATVPTQVPYLQEVHMAKLVKGQDMIGYTPLETVRFKISGGGANYVHGGLSMQEMVVPVLVYKNMRTGGRGYVEVQKPGLILYSENRKLVSRNVSLRFYQKHPIGEKVEPATYKLRFTDDQGRVISDEQMIIADKESRDNSERIFRVNFQLKAMNYDKQQIYRLLVADNDGQIEEIEFQIDIAFGEDVDFGF